MFQSWCPCVTHLIRDIIRGAYNNATSAFIRDISRQMAGRHKIEFYFVREVQIFLCTGGKI